MSERPTITTADGVKCEEGDFVWLCEYFWPSRPEKVRREKLRLANDKQFAIGCILVNNTSKLYSSPSAARKALIEKLKKSVLLSKQLIVVDERHIAVLEALNEQEAKP